MTPPAARESPAKREFSRCRQRGRVNRGSRARVRSPAFRSLRLAIHNGANGPAVPVIIQITVLALASTIRPTSLAAVYALARGRAPRRLMTAYVLTGLAFTIAFGLAVVWVFHGVELHASTDRTKGLAEIAAGIIAVGFGIGVWTGRVGRGSGEDAPRPPGRVASRIGGEPGVRTAALTGPATHLPGLFYLLALDLIVASQRHLAGGVFDILVYNVVWFAVPIGALVLCIVHPPAARRAVEAVRDRISAHARTIMLLVGLGGGAVLIVAGALAL